MTQFISLVEFNWLSALSRFSVNLLFIGIMILLTARHISLRRFSFTFLMISLIVYFLCYTLKNFDLNLGMALGLFAIFGIIRYRTEPLQTDRIIPTQCFGFSLYYFWGILFNATGLP